MCSIGQSASGAGSQSSLADESDGDAGVGDSDSEMQAMMTDADFAQALASRGGYLFSQQRKAAATAAADISPPGAVYGSRRPQPCMGVSASALTQSACKSPLFHSLNSSEMLN